MSREEHKQFIKQQKTKASADRRCENERKKMLREYFILENECDAETMRTAIINSNEMFSIDEVTIAVKGNFLYSVLHDKNTYMEYEDESSAREAFKFLKEKLQYDL